MLAHSAQGITASLSRAGPAILLALGMLALMLQSGLIEVWIESDEYSHGPLVLMVLGYLVYGKRDSFPVCQTPLGWPVVALALVPFALFLTGAASDIGQFQKQSVWLFLVLIVYAAGGRPLLIALAAPLLIALMTIPLPNKLEMALTSQLQLISSQVGVWFIRQFGGVVHLQGNVIDMGSIKLLVDEACSGLRYLYPLMGLGGIAAYVFQGPLWAKWALFLVTVPITIFMNSFRIAVTGLLVENNGVAHTEGFLHFFEGWIVFVAALIALALFARLLLALQKQPRDFLDSFSVDPTGHQKHSSTGLSKGRIPRYRYRAVLSVLVIILCAALIAPAFSLRSEVQPERTPLSEFPLRLGNWGAQQHRLPLLVEEVAGATDYYYADFTSAGKGAVNLYLSYYNTQRQGRIPHSPVVCMPGDGWTIASLKTASIETGVDRPFAVNRLVITKGDRTLLAYYWLKQGDRSFRQDTLARLDLVRSSILDNRTDGGLIRLVAELVPGETLAELDERLIGFTSELAPILASFIPD
ncbi:MAG: VPLPA-CTERM-specific exosortase XrtD [Oleiphilaceae bacterium]|nr:VPLPA-CTERM-specific exosortase XrtD [Oleiphilaceae bacterium]